MDKKTPVLFQAKAENEKTYLHHEKGGFSVAEDLSMDQILVREYALMSLFPEDEEEEETHLKRLFELEN
jgi:hypothetical protein